MTYRRKTRRGILNVAWAISELGVFIVVIVVACAAAANGDMSILPNAVPALGMIYFLVPEVRARFRLLAPFEVRASGPCITLVSPEHPTDLDLPRDEFVAVDWTGAPNGSPHDLGFIRFHAIGRRIDVYGFLFEWEAVAEVIRKATTDEPSWQDASTLLRVAGEYSPTTLGLHIESPRAIWVGVPDCSYVLEGKRDKDRVFVSAFRDGRFLRTSTAAGDSDHGVTLRATGSADVDYFMHVHASRILGEPIELSADEVEATEASILRSIGSWPARMGRRYGMAVLVIAITVCLVWLTVA